MEYRLTTHATTPEAADPGFDTIEGYDPYLDLAEWFNNHVRDRSEPVWAELVFLAVHLRAEHVEANV